MSIVTNVLPLTHLPKYDLTKGCLLSIIIILKRENNEAK
jgi:hypothetical protein